MNKVHIVWVTPNGDRIIDQFARVLAEYSGWSLSDQPSKSAQLNLAMLYIDLAQRFPDWRHTPWAAYFSHFEQGTSYKELFWRNADQMVALRLLTARQYLNIVGRPAAVFPVPLDHETFQIHPQRKSVKPVFGISGRLDPAGRKGEKTLKEIASEFAGKIEFQAWGEGWPVKMAGRGEDMSRLARFYNTLHAYICTSTIEGVPMPPLSCLACGVPVVIPRGVGMLDDLPEMEGIFRYEHYEELQEATRQALKFEPTPEQREALREVTLDYTPEAFSQAIMQAVEGVMPREHPMQVKVREPEKKDSGKRGLVYVAYGKPARKCAVSAIASWRKFFPEIPVGVISDQPLGVEDVHIQHKDADIGGRLAKVSMYDLAPKEWSRVMYLDADTEVIARETFLFDVLDDGWDMVICKNPERFAVAIYMRRPDNQEECEETYRKLGTDEVIQLYGGALAFRRNERTRAFFHAWEEEWKRYGKRDQGALLRALWKHPLKLYVIGNEWNLTPRYDSIDNAAWLLHYHTMARRHQGIMMGRLDSEEAWDEIEKFGLSPRDEVTW